MNNLNITSDVYAPVLDDACNYVDTSIVTFPLICPCTNKEFFNKNGFNAHRKKTKKHKDWLAELNANKTNFYKETIQLNALVKQQCAIIVARDNMIQTKELQIAYLKKQLQKPEVNLFELD